MTADAIQMETLLRIEHKLDLLLSRIPTENELTKVGSNSHSCPVCKQQVNYNVDINDSVVVRKCGCSTGKIAIDMKAFAPPVNPARKTDNDRREDEQEDRNDSLSRRKQPGSR